MLWRPLALAARRCGGSLGITGWSTGPATARHTGPPFHSWPGVPCRSGPVTVIVMPHGEQRANGEGGDSLGGSAPRPGGEEPVRRSRWLACVSGVGRAAHALVRLMPAARRIRGRTMIDLATVGGRATVVGSSEPCRSWGANTPSVTLSGRSGSTSLFKFAWHNKSVNRTCHGRPRRAVISLFARRGLPWHAGYRRRYAAWE